MQLVKWQKTLHNVWAKSPLNNSQPETIVEHTQKVLDRLSQLKKRLLYVSLLKEDALWRWAYLACLLHDFGKAARGFQESLRRNRSWAHRHEVLSLAFLPWILPNQSKDYQWVVAGIVSHHKNASEILEERYNLNFISIDSMRFEIDRRVIEALWYWLNELKVVKKSTNGTKIIDNFYAEGPLAIFEGLKLYNKLIEELMQEPANSIKNRKALLLKGLVMQADHLASANAPELASVSLPNVNQICALLGLNKNKLRSYQIAASKCLGSLFFSAPTGSGKTEAAILWASTQQKVSKVNRHLIYILPYQASLNAMYKRLKKLLSCDVALMHSRSLQAIYRELLDFDFNNWDATKGAKLANNLAKLYQPAVWCATPYQLLKAAYKAPGYEALWTSLSGSLVIVDEIHAYEPARLGMFLELLKELYSNWDVDLCIMTATMPTWLKNLLEKLLCKEQLQVEKQLFNAFQRHKLKLVPGNIFGHQAIDYIKKEYLTGRSVLVGVNSVKTAQQICQQIYEEIKYEPLLLHSRFTIRDRLAKEKLLIEAQSLNGELKKDGSIVVATQVIEVSLNLDFDTIITEPAPLEALVQRFGRVNRAGKKGIVQVMVCTDTMPWDIYDQELIAQTLKVLSKNNGLLIDELQVSYLLDQVYNEAIEKRYVDEILHHRKEFKTNCLDTLRAFQSDRKMADLFDQLFDGTEVVPVSEIESFKQLSNEAPIEAKSLFVPLSWKQFKQLEKHKLACFDRELGVRVVIAPYNFKSGLLIEN